MRKGEKKITLEQYLRFYQEPQQSNISRPHLNQIIDMHGIMKLHNQPKWRLMECLESIELMPPSRSTLEQAISSCAFLPPGEVAEDLEAIGWQESTVRSIQTVKSGAEQEYFMANMDLPFTSPSSTCDRRTAPLLGLRRRQSSSSRASPATFVISGRRPRSKRKRVSIYALTAATASVPPPPVTPPPATPSPPSSPPASPPNSPYPSPPPPPLSPPPDPLF